MPIYGDQFKRYKGNKRVYVETGFLAGDSAQKALDAGFEEIHAIDIDVQAEINCKERFGNSLNVHFYLGDSAYKLKEVLNQITEPVLLYLDAHFGIHNGVYTPLLHELHEILSLGQKENTIAIDDIRLLKGNEGAIPYSLQEVIDVLKQINPKYKITFEKGFQENDVLFATID